MRDVVHQSQTLARSGSHPCREGYFIPGFFYVCSGEQQSYSVVLLLLCYASLQRLEGTKKAVETPKARAEEYTR